MINVANSEIEKPIMENNITNSERRVVIPTLFHEFFIVNFILQGVKK